MKAILVLEDGTVVEGQSNGVAGTTLGELVFNTSMTGYQEIYTDPSYAGQIVILTYPLIGNYGTNEIDVESFKPHIRGMVVRELCPAPNSWRLRFSLSDFLQRHRVIGIVGVDTRALTRHLRSYGTMRCGLSTEVNSKELLKMVRTSPDISGQDLVATVTTSAPYRFLYPIDKMHETEGRKRGRKKHKISIIDCGVKYNQPRSLISRGCEVTVVPAKTSADAILREKTDGVVISNGPGDPKDVPYVIETVRELLGRIPIMGICLGHQILALALGADTYKMKFGHRGANQPVKDMVRGRVVVTSQNHGYAVVNNGLGEKGIRVSHVNVNDGTIEGIEHDDYPIISVQFHPEASPGPMDSGYLFDEFLMKVSSWKQGKD
ncbi:MAG: glutamine-hydrolyzing carbamoyl-phosphate synthase small subunit [bacterium]